MIASVFGMSKQEAKILVIGLDNSGKSTLIHHLKPKTTTATPFEVTPTVGFQIEEFKKNNINFTVFDMSGQVCLNRWAGVVLAFIVPMNAGKIPLIMGALLSRCTGNFAAYMI